MLETFRVYSWLFFSMSVLWVISSIPMTFNFYILTISKVISSAQNSLLNRKPTWLFHLDVSQTFQIHSVPNWTSGLCHHSTQDTNMFLLLVFPFPKLALPNAQLFKPRNFRLILDDSLFLTQVVTSSLSPINSASEIKYWSIYLFPFPASLNQSGMNYHISVPCPL